MTVAPTGTNIGVRINSSENLGMVRDIVDHLGWQPLDQEEVDVLLSLRVGPQAKKGKKNYHLLFLGASRVSRSLELSEVLDYLKELLPDVARATAQDCVFIPGSVIEWQDSLLVLPGNGKGRRTLMKEFEQKGANIIDDKFFAIQPDGSLKMGDEQVYPAKTPTLVCFTEHEPRNKSLRTRRLTPGESSLHLFAQGIGSRSAPALAMAAVSRFASEAVSTKGKRGEAEQAVVYLTKKLSSLPEPVK